MHVADAGACRPQVGRRKRARPAPDARGATIPLERSLVPISMYALGRPAGSEE